ncbi:hypothetical protein Y032_0487g2341 [Ancylostoma ceylanicum]|uniref:EGF-like domain-containing protein n=1 Tax=Ancylostoma ceylanicum TaxID=53326 RepID=A0A016WWJ5_9BILA|nr:hypothetical protein Y032_0487g2341 [Ancylostoma ceylanicum]
MDFIYNETRALYPSIYLDGKRTLEQNFRFVRALLTETRRTVNPQLRRVNYYAYTKFEFILKVKERANKCRASHCSGNGNCVLRKPRTRCYKKMNPKKYVCRCDRGFEGQSCSQKARTSNLASNKSF